MTVVEFAESPVAPWRADLYTHAINAGRGPLFLRRTDGWMLPLEVERWCDGADPTDLAVLAGTRGSVLDIGCGPGRLVAALRRLGRHALGIDISAAAVDRTIRAGGLAVCRSVFDSVPAEGRWDTALLMDGNIGIGGQPRELLNRIATIVAPGGMLLTEVAAVEVDERLRVSFDDGSGRLGTAFPWARLGVEALLEVVTGTNWRPRQRWESAGRRFVRLQLAAED